MRTGLTGKDFDIFSKRNELNLVETQEGTLTLAGLFLPIFGELVLKNLMNTVSVFILGRVSDDAVAAVGLAGQILTIVMLLHSAIGIGVTVVIGQNLGAGRRERAEDSAAAAIWIGILLPLLLSAASPWFLTPLVRLMQLEERLVPDAVAYLRITVGLCVFHSVMTICMAECRAFGNTLYPVLVSLLMNVIHTAFSYVVIFRPFETPFFGIAGMAWARVASELLSCLVMVRLLKRVHPAWSLRRKGCVSWPVIRDILHIGGPRVVQTLSYHLSQSVTTKVMASLGAAALASKIYVTNIVTYVYLLGMSLGQATGLMAGWLAGQGRYGKLRRLVFRNLIINVAANGVLSALAALYSTRLLGIFTRDGAIIALGSSIMLIDILVEMGRGANHCFENALIAAGDSRFPMKAMLATSWGLSVLFYSDPGNMGRPGSGRLLDRLCDG